MFVSYRLHDFLYKAQKKSKTYANESTLPSWNDVAV